MTGEEWLAELRQKMEPDKDEVITALRHEIERLKVKLIERDSAIAGWIKRLKGYGEPQGTGFQAGEAEPKRRP